MSYRHQKNRSLGPRVKINIPKFAFEEAQQEERNVESFLDQQQGNQNNQQDYQNDLYNAQNQENEENYNENSNRSITNAFNNDLTQNRLPANNANLPLIQNNSNNNNNRRSSSTQRPNSQQHQKNSQMNQSQVGQSNNYSFTMNNGNHRSSIRQSVNQQNDSALMQQPQRSHSKSLLDQSQFQNNQSNILNGSTISQNGGSPNKQQQQQQDNQHLNWISTLARKEQAKIVRMPARNPQRIQITMNQQQKINNHILDVSSIMNESALMNKTIGTNQQKTAIQRQNSKLDESTMRQEEKSTIMNKSRIIVGKQNGNTLDQSQLMQSANKKQSKQAALIESSQAGSQQIKASKGNQKTYDRWDSERAPEEWLKLYKNQQGSHGMCTVHLNNKQNPYLIASYKTFIIFK